MSAVTNTILAYVRWDQENEDSQWASGPVVDPGYRLSFCGFHYARVWPVRGGCWQSIGYLGDDVFGSLKAAQSRLTDRLVLHLEAVEVTTNGIGISYVDSSVRDFLAGKISDGWNTRRGPIFPIGMNNTADR